MKNIFYASMATLVLLLSGCADAGKDQTVKSSNQVTLDGTSSTASVYGKIKKYKWIQVDGTQVELIDPTSPSPTFAAPTVTQPTTLQFKLMTVERGGYLSPFRTYDYTSVTIEPNVDINTAPVAVASASASTVKEGNSVSFSATDSSDNEGNIVSYEWKDTQGSILSTEATFAYTFATTGMHTLTLTVTDEGGLSSSANVSVEVLELQAPEAIISASADRAFIGESVNFDANASSDSDGQIVSYTWTDGNGTTFGNMQTLSHVFETSGLHTITLSVLDDDGQETQASTTINVEAMLTSIDLSSSVQSLLEGNTTTLTATAHYNDESSEDATESVEWVIADTSILSIDANGTLFALQEGTATITAQIGEMFSNTITVEVVAPDTTPPVITVNGTDVSIIEGSTYADAGASAVDDVEGTLPVTTTGTVDSATVGSYIITYTATDTAGNSATATRTVTVTDGTPPVITIIGADVSIVEGSSYEDAGATALDNVDGPLPVTTSGTANTSLPGVYTITYTATDAAGYTSTVIRTVTVTAIPVFTRQEPHTFSNCLGHIEKSGKDTNRNGILEDSEITSENPIYLEGEPITREELITMIHNGEDVTGVNTCEITDLSGSTLPVSYYNPQDLEGAISISSELIPSDFNQDISNWNTGAVTNMAGMFKGAVNFNQDISSWDVSNVTDMSLMFGGEGNNPTTFNHDLSNWDVSHVTHMFGMFMLSSFNSDITTWDVGNVTNMIGMFSLTQSFDQDISNWDISNVTGMSFMFSFSSLSTVNYDNLLKTWSTLDLQENVDFGALPVQYSSEATTARQYIIDTFGWTITDGGLAP